MEDVRHEHRHTATKTAKLVRDLVPSLIALSESGEYTLNDVAHDMRLLARRASVTRQTESIQATLRLAESNLGHLGVAFVRPACEEFLWLKYLETLNRQDANEVFQALGTSDIMRSVVASRGFIGDNSLIKIGFPPAFLNGVEGFLGKNKSKIAALKLRLGWDRNTGPTTRWVAEKVDELRLYEYLFAASSRAVHFSPGEAMRRGWFTPDGQFSVQDSHHRVFLSDYALDQLGYLLLLTILVLDQMHKLSAAEITPPEGLLDEDIRKRVEAFLNASRIPLIIPSEYELIWNRLPGNP